MIMIRLTTLFWVLWGSLLLAETSTPVDYFYDDKQMPVCVSSKDDPGNGVVIFWDKYNQVRPRTVQYLSFNELTYHDLYRPRRSSIRNCHEVKYLDTQFLIGKNINFDQSPDVFYIENFKIEPYVIERLMQVSHGQNKFFDEKNASEEFVEGLFSSFKTETNKKITSDYGTELATKMYHRYIKSKKFPEDCKELIGKCDYYLCKESKKMCNSQGYYIGFGYQYCSESLDNLMKKVSPIGKNWLKTTATCLQKKMETFSSDLSCQEIKAEAIRTHDECYSEISFCSLKLNDMTQILKMIYPTLTDMSILKEGVEVLKHCGGKPL